MFTLADSWRERLLPWLPVAKFLAILFVLVGVFFVGRNVGADAVRAQWNEDKLAKADEYRRALDAQIDRHALALVRQAVQAGELQKRLEDERVQSEALRIALDRSQLVTDRRKNVTDCPDPRISRAFGLCYAAAFTGDPAELAACEAASRPLSGAADRRGLSLPPGVRESRTPRSTGDAR